MRSNEQDPIKQLQDQNAGLAAQLEAAKAMFNEQATSNLQAKANIQILLQENNKLAQQVKTLTAKVLELSPPKENENAANP